MPSPWLIRELRRYEREDAERAERERKAREREAAEYRIARRENEEV